VTVVTAVTADSAVTTVVTVTTVTTVTICHHQGLKWIPCLCVCVCVCECVWGVLFPTFSDVNFVLSRHIQLPQRIHIARNKPKLNLAQSFATGFTHLQRVTRFWKTCLSQLLERVLSRMNQVVQGNVFETVTKFRLEKCLFTENRFWTRRIGWEAHAPEKLIFSWMHWIWDVSDRFAPVVLQLEFNFQQSWTCFSF
jgi:hypothetical protein